MPSNSPINCFTWKDYISSGFPYFCRLNTDIKTKCPFHKIIPTIQQYNFNLIPLDNFIERNVSSFHKITSTIQYNNFNIIPLDNLIERNVSSFHKITPTIQQYNNFNLIPLDNFIESIYLYFPPSSQLLYLCFCPVGLSLL